MTQIDQSMDLELAIEQEEVRSLLVDITTEHFGRRLYFGRTDSSELEYIKMLTLCNTPDIEVKLIEDMKNISEKNQGKYVELLVSPINNSWDSFTLDIKKSE